MSREYAEARREEIEKEISKTIREQNLYDKYKRPGIYCIKIEDKIVYIGKSIHIIKRLAEHLYEIELVHSKSNKYKVLREAKLTGYKISFDVLYKTRKRKTDRIEEDIGQKEGEYIRKYLPPLNYQIPLEEDWHKFKPNPKAKKITLQEIMGS